MMKMQWIGMPQLKLRLERAGKMAPVYMGQVLHVEAVEIMADSKPLVPVDEGVLRGSGVVGTPVVTGTMVVQEMGYGGPASDYALRQHEDLSYKHTVGQAKFLEQPFTEHAETLDTRLVGKLDRLFA